MEDAILVYCGKLEALFFPSTEEVDHEGVRMAPSDFVTKAGCRGATKWKSAIKCKPDTGRKRSMSLGALLDQSEAKTQRKKPKQKQGTKLNGVVQTTRKFPRKVELERRLCVALEDLKFEVAAGDEEAAIPPKMRSSRGTAARPVVKLTQMSPADFKAQMVTQKRRHPTELLGSLTVAPSKEALTEVEVPTVGYKRMNLEDRSYELGYLFVKEPPEDRDLTPLLNEILALAPSLDIDGQSIVLQDLYQQVMARGGYEAVTSNQLWDEIGCQLGLKRGGRSTGQKLQEIYQQQLLVSKNC